MYPGANHQSSSGIQCTEQIRAQNMEKDNALLPKVMLSLMILSHLRECQELAQQEVHGTFPIPQRWFWTPHAFTRHYL